MSDKPDWADEIEREISAVYGSHGATLAADADGMIATALRKVASPMLEAHALIEKMYEAIDLMTGYIDHMPAKKHETVKATFAEATAFLAPRLSGQNHDRHR